MQIKEQFMQMKASFPTGRFALALAGVFLALVVHLGCSAEQAVWVVRHFGYYFLLGAFLGLLAYLLLLGHRTQEAWLSGLRAMGWPFIFFMLACASLCFVHLEFGPKVLMDDAILTATAKQMHETREVFTPSFGRWRQNAFDVFDGYVDKRPILYAFAVSLIHDLSGYRAANPYLANALFGLIFLGLSAWLGALLAGRKAALLLPLLWVSLPLFSQNASGAGMDMINLMMIALVLSLAVLYWKRLDGASEGALALAAVLLAHGRYESGLFVIPVAAVIVLGWVFQGKIILSTGTICAAPLLIGLLLQNKFFAQSKDLWELHSGTVQPFALSHISQNLEAALYFYFNLGGDYANSFWLALLGLPATVFFVFYLARHGRALLRQRSPHIVFGLFGLFLVLQLFLILCYHDGRLDRLFASRFALPSYLLITISIIVVLEQFTRRTAVWAVFIVGTFISIIGFTLPANSKAIFTQRNYVANELAWLESLQIRYFEPRSLVIDVYTIPWTIREISSISPLQAYGNALRLYEELEAGKYAGIYLVDRRVFANAGGVFELQPSTLPPGVFDVELIAEKSFKPFELTRVYRVMGVDPAAAGQLHADSD